MSYTKTIHLIFCVFGFSLLFAQSETNIDSLKHQAEVLLKQKHYLEYTNNLKQQIALSRLDKNLENELLAHRKLTTFFIDFENNLDSLEQYCKSGLKLAQSYNNQKYIDNFNFIKGRYLTERGKYIEAYDLYNSLEESINTNKYEFLPHYYTAFAKLHYKLGEYNLAFKKLKRASEVFSFRSKALDISPSKRRKELINTSSVYNNLGILYRLQNQLDSSLTYYNKALDLSKLMNDTIGMAYAYNNIGRVYSQKNDLIKSENYYLKAFQINPKNPSKNLINNFSTILLLKGKYRSAEHIINIAFKDSTIPENRIERLRSLAKIKTVEGNYYEALRLKDSLIFEKEKLLDVKKIEEIENLKIRFETEKKEKEIQLLKTKAENQELRMKQNKIVSFVVLLIIFLLFIIGGLVIRNKYVTAKANRVLLEQQLFRSQMNPHFIFNALSNIQSTILQNENEKAVGYLSKFAKLVRSILENSKESKITLSKEIKAIEQYLDLQKIRFNNSFNYVITLDEAIEDEITLIPTMLFQPFIENAVEHGIETIENGEIEINFSLKEKHIECLIKDNGVGYSKTQNISNPSKESMSTTIVKNRLAIFSKKIKQDLKLTISDIKENNVVKGTQVHVDIPILN